jgi:indolepyruvate ferredoxin oxidoreductase beta subunit
MAQRGGSVVSHLKIGSTCGPLVSSGDAHILLSLEKNETYKNLHFLRPKGTCFANVPSPDFLAKSVLTYIKSHDISLYGINADEIALASGALVASNVIMLGLLSSWPGSPFSREDLLSVIADVGAKRFNEKNTEVFDKGHRMGKERYFAD